jgi:hypothetical protein
MPILIVLVVIVAVIGGAIWSFDTLSAQLGEGVALGAAVVVVVLVAWAIAWFVRRRREIAPNTHSGDWTHTLQSDWGSLSLAADKRLLAVTKDGVSGNYIFADLRASDVTQEGGQWQVVLHVKDEAHATWVLPMPSAHEARRWGRILNLAAEERL